MMKRSTDLTDSDGIAYCSGLVRAGTVREHKTRAFSPSRAQRSEKRAATQLEQERGLGPA